MRTLNERTEIATAINFHKYPTVRIDVSDKDKYGIKGSKVLIDAGTFNDGSAYLIKATLRTYNDEAGLHFSSGCVGISSSFGYNDIEEILEYRNVPVIKADEDILVCFVNAESKVAYAPVVLHTGKINNHCSAPLTIEDVDCTKF